MLKGSKFTKNKLIRYVNGDYLLYRTKKKYDQGIYYVNLENDEYVLYHISQKVDAEYAKSYFLEMKDTIAALKGVEEAEKTYDHYMTAFNLIEKEQIEEEEIVAEVTDTNPPIICKASKKKRKTA